MLGLVILVAPMRIREEMFVAKRLRAMLAFEG